MTHSVERVVGSVVRSPAFRRFGSRTARASRSAATNPPEGGTPNAFTVMELLVVMAIIAVLTAVALPAVKTIGKDNDRVQAVNQVRAMLSQARAIALAQHRQAGVVFFMESPSHALPVHGDQVALQIFVEDYDQTTTPAKNPRNTLFLQYSAARAYLPVGIAIAALNDMPTKGVINGDSTGGHDLAILFDATGQRVLRHGVARRDLPSPAGAPGTYPEAIADWNFATQGTTKSDNSSNGISSPGVFLYDRDAYLTQAIPEGAAGDAARTAWIRQNASVIVINANTGGIQ